MTDAQYAAWLVDPSAIRVVLVDATANVSGTETVRHMATRAYTTGATDTPANTAYLPVLSVGLRFTEAVSLTAAANLAAGDIEIHNLAGERDSWLSDIWANRSVQAWIGDVRWARSDFRMIFNGVAANLDSQSREKLNLVLRDKLQRLNAPVTDHKLGGTTPNKDAIVPLVFGEVHNVTPLLTDPMTLEYQVHDGALESIFEVRDNGIPLTGTAAPTVNLSTGKFTLVASPSGTITVSAQGDKPSVYYNTISQLIQRLATGYGKASDRFTSGDLDAANLAAFDSAHPQAVGLPITDRTNVLAACQMLASSIGAQIVMSRLGLLRLIQINLPAVGTPTAIYPNQMKERSLQIVSRTDVQAAVKLGFCKNWTVQAGLLTTIPAQHKDLFATEWLTATAVDSGVQATYKLTADPVQQDTMLLTRADAAAEAARQRDIFKVQRTVYQFEGTAVCLLLELGQAVTLYNSRYNLNSGVLGMVVSLAPDWQTGSVTVQVLV